MRSRLIDFGESIEKIDNVPLIDKLTNLLPFAMVAACLKECPGQTMIALTGLLFYVVLKKNSMRKVKYSIQQKKNQRMYDKKIKKLYVGSH